MADASNVPIYCNTIQAPPALLEHSSRRKPWENDGKSINSLSLWERARVREIISQRSHPALPPHPFQGAAVQQPRVLTVGYFPGHTDPG